MALKLQAEIALDGSGLQRGVNQALSGVKNMVAGAFTIGAITQFTRKTIEFAGHLTDLSARLAISTDYLQEMQFVMKQSGGSVDDLTAAFEKLGAARIAALGGDEKMAANFARFGIGIDQLKTSSSQALMDSIAAQFKQLGNNDELKSAFREIGGRGAGVLVPAFVEGLEEGRNQARQAGSVASADLIQQLDEIGDKFDALSMVLMAQVAPAIIAVAEAAKYLISGIQQNASFWGAATSNVNASTVAKAGMKGLLVNNPMAAMVELLKSVDTKLGTTAEDDAFRGFVEAAAAAAEARRKRASSRQGFDYSNITPPTSSLAIKPERATAFSDSLLSVGNFLGSGRSTLESVAHKQLRVAERMAESLDKLVKKDAPTIKVP